MATFLHNISGELETVLIPSGSTSISEIHIANSHATDSTYCDVYIGTISKAGKSAVSYYIIRGYLLHKGESLILNSKAISIRAIANGVFIKLTGITNTTPTVDVIISK